MMDNKIILTKNFDQVPIGKVEFFDTDEGQLMIKQIEENPEKFIFEIGYTQHNNGKAKLVEISVVNKYE